MRPVRRGLLISLAVAGVLASGGPLSARQAASATELKAAFLLTFARYTTWSPVVLPTGARLAICVAGDDRIVGSLDALARQQQVQDHALVVRRIGIDTLAGCHLLFWSGGDGDERRTLLQAVARKPVLTVSDDADFARAGGMINVLVDGERMRFAVNPAAAERAGLRISSRLLNLALIVKDVAHAP